MTGRVAISAGTTLVPAAGVDAVPLAQATSERLGLAVAALIALAVLAVLGGVLVALLRRRAQARSLGRHDGVEPGARTPEEALWSAGGATGAGARAEAGAAAEPGRDDDEEEEAPREDAGAVAGTARPLPEAHPEPAAVVPDAPSPPAGEGLGVRPPLPQEAWSAEIVWAAHATRFRVVARRSDDVDAEPVAIAQTEPLPWPPRDDASVQALTDASATLEAVLLDSGWTALPTGQAWYSKRFAWAAQAAAPEAPRPTGRFDRRRTQAPEPARPAPVAGDAGPLPQ
jgi:hypothetical protein